jgi:hypothetical protein
MATLLAGEAAIVRIAPAGDSRLLLCNLPVDFLGDFPVTLLGMAGPV